jgi:hypothetical protein
MEYQKKREKEKNLQESLQIKGEVNILRGENTSTSKFLFDVIPFSPPPPHHTISKTLSKIIEKNSLTLFVPSFSLVIYVT